MTEPGSFASAHSTEEIGPPPAVSIVIPCRNEARHIRSCLESILALDEPIGGFEVIVADGMSDDGTRETVLDVADGDHRVRMIDNLERITPCAMNTGILAARADIVIRMDAHTEYASDYVVECLRVMAETSADNVGGPVLTRATGYIQRAVSATFHSRFAVGNGSFHQPEFEGPTDTVPYGCYRKDRLVSIGLFDEELVRNQDDELNFRLVQAGGVIWQSPRIKAWYTPRGSLPKLFKQYFQYGYWKVRVIQKRGQPASWRHLVPGTFAALLTILALAAPISPAARWGAGALLATYLSGLFLASVAAAAQNGLSLFPALLFTFPCYHFGYGYGFLTGVWDFVLRKRRGRFVALSRA